MTGNKKENSAAVWLIYRRGFLFFGLPIEKQTVRTRGIYTTIETCRASGVTGTAILLLFDY